jgi:hypothetical protein
VESHYNPVVDGAFQNVEPDFALAPGKCAIYKIFMTVPKDWTGEKYVSFIAQEPEVAEGGGLTSSADEDVIYQTFALEPGEYRPVQNSSMPSKDRNRLYMATIDIDEATAGGDPVADAPLEYWTEESGGYAAGNGSATSGSNVAGGRATATTTPAATTTSSRSSLPTTGDFLAAGVAAGIAGAGAALAAYGKRRAKNEDTEDK